jgi:DNA polymerase-3 subunit delta
MNKVNVNIPSVYSMVSKLSESNLKPIYFIYGEDHFTLNAVVKSIEKTVIPQISSDFDNETLSVEKKANISEVIDLAYTFPFGSQKKLLIVKNFENFNNKKQLLDYIDNPSNTTILILVNYGSISTIKSEPYISLNSKNYLFEARELKGSDLQSWVTRRSKQLGFEISSENTQLLIEIVGEDKSLLEMQLQKFKSFLGNNNNINAEEIKKLSSATKEYSIFDLLNVIGQGNLKDSLKVINNLLNQNKDLVFIITMLTKYFTVIAQSLELQSRNLSDFDAAKTLGISKYYYINCKKARYFNGFS